MEVPCDLTARVRTDTFPAARPSLPGANPEQPAPSCPDACLCILGAPSLSPQLPGPGVTPSTASTGPCDTLRALPSPPPLLLAHDPVCSPCPLLVGPGSGPTLCELDMGWSPCPQLTTLPEYECLKGRDVLSVWLYAHLPHYLQWKCHITITQYLLDAPLSM